MSDTGTATEEADIFQRIKVFPNPSTDVIYVEMESSVSQVEIEVLTVLGKVVSRQVQGGGGTIPVKWEGTPGMYPLRVQADGKTSTRKIMKE